MRKKNSLEKKKNPDTVVLFFKFDPNLVYLVSLYHQIIFLCSLTHTPFLK